MWHKCDSKLAFQKYVVLGNVTRVTIKIIVIYQVYSMQYNLYHERVLAWFVFIYITFETPVYMKSKSSPDNLSRHFY